MSIARLIVVYNLIVFVFVETLLNKHETLNNLSFSLNDSKLFELFVYMYGKKYNVISEEGKHRFKIFADSLKFIREHNLKLKCDMFTCGDSLAITRFADLTHDEFKISQLNGKSLGAGIKTGGVKLLKNSEEEVIHPKKCLSIIDWRSVLLPARNQQTCGSCWAFSSAASIEGALAISGKPKEYVSVQNLVDCSHNSNYGCNGGFPHAALEFATTKGLVFDSAYPYTNVQGSCYNLNPMFKITGYSYCNEIYGVTEIKKCGLSYWLDLLLKGPIVVVVDAQSRVFQYYNKGIITLQANDCQDINHAVVAVGFNNGIITVRNSWGRNWGDEGYFHIKYDPDLDNTCFITASAYLPLV
jgi:hypothetical protein